MCYLLSADAYVTFRQLFRYYYFDLDLKYIFLKHESEFDVSLTKRNRADLKKVSDFLTTWMIVANAQNVVGVASLEENRLPTTEQLAKDYLNSGSCNYRWLGAAEISKQLIVKALDWYLSQSNGLPSATAMDTQSDTPICKLIEEVNGKYAVKIVKQMPGSFQIPSVYY